VFTNHKGLWVGDQAGNLRHGTCDQ